MLATLGHWVKLREKDETDVEIFHLVEDREAKIVENRLPTDNALARALEGARAGDEICMDAPAGRITFEVLEVGRD
jgi:transcription elongation GreA/GreB family factor